MRTIYFLYYHWSSTYKFEYMVVKANSTLSTEVTYTVKGREFNLSLERWKYTKSNLLKRGFKRLPMSYFSK